MPLLASFIQAALVSSLADGAPEGFSIRPPIAPADQNPPGV
jgi:hypothetical protein